MSFSPVGTNTECPQRAGECLGPQQDGELLLGREKLVQREEAIPRNYEEVQTSRVWSTEAIPLPLMHEQWVLKEFFSPSTLKEPTK